MKFNLKSINKEIRYKIIFILLVIISSLIILIYALNEERKPLFLESTIKDIIVSTQKVIYSPFRFVFSKTKEELLNCNLLKTQNEELQRELLAMQEILELNNSFTNYELINATVVNRNIGNWFNTLTIDKGIKAGVKVDTPVIVKQGLIGKIISTTNYTSEVKLITTSNLTTKISVAIINNNNELTYGLIAGYKNNRIIINSIIDDSLIAIGNKVITSGLSNIFPKGIIVGEVVSIKLDEIGISKILYVNSEVNFNDIRFVSILNRGEKKQ